MAARLTRSGPWVLVGTAVILAVGPYLFGEYGLRFLFTALLYVALAQAWNLFSGFTGYVSFGHVLFFGIGAYTFALAQLKIGLPWWLCLLLAAGVAVTVSLIIAAIVLREQMGVAYFAVLMLGLNEIMLQVVSNSKTLGASYGFTLQSMPHQLVGYYGMLGVAVGVTATVMWLQRSPVGMALRALQADEQAAAVAGINCYWLKATTFAASAGAIGILGALVAWNWRYIDPYLAFDLQLTFKMVLMAVVGGTGTAWGPVIGAVGMSVLDEWLSVTIPGLHTIIFGALLVVVVLRMPGGLVDLGKWMGRRRALLIRSRCPQLGRDING